jgi:hypothetical protein
MITNKSFPIIEKIIREADRYVKLVSFLFYDDRLCDLLIEKHRSSGVNIEVLTTPPEAAESADLKEAAIQIQDRLEAAGVKVIPCDWEVGQPELTIATRAGGRVPRWFAMHGKCLVTDKSALVTSADVTQNFSLDHDWDTHVIYTDSKRIALLCRKYEKLKEIFLNVPSYIGSEYIDTTVSPRKLIRGYPLEKIPELSLQDGSYFLPHEGYGRKIIERAIQNADEFIYLMFETIFDDELTRFILRKLISDPTIDFRIITSPLAAYVQNKPKTRATFAQLASYGAKIRTLRNLRAKMLITDKVVISGSFDLVKMGIGFIRRKALVASTEIMDVNTHKKFIKSAKTQFSHLFMKSVEEYGLWFVKDAVKILRATGAKRISGDAKELLGYMIFNEGKKSSDRIKRISFIAVEIARMRNTVNPYVKPMDIQRAEQILVLQDRKELDDESIRGILGILDARPFLRKLRSYKVLT